MLGNESVSVSTPGSKLDRRLILQTGDILKAVQQIGQCSCVDLTDPCTQLNSKFIFLIKNDVMCVLYRPLMDLVGLYSVDLIGTCSTVGQKLFFHNLIIEWTSKLQNSFYRPFTFRKTVNETGDSIGLFQHVSLGLNPWTHRETN